MISNRRIIIFSLIFILLTLDQSSKIIINSYFNLHDPKHIFPFFTLYLTHNTGISFSMLSNISPIIIVGIRILIIALIIFIWNKNTTNRIADLGYILIIAGALGNIVDHCLYGYVIDYIMLHTKTWSFAIFNLADLLISLGACSILYNDLIIKHNQKEKSTSHH
ncbi:signal peptidase II [Candidatus Liberibacter africanus]|uniref:Lipoprotein signal peptidase n=1 Tax=Candidatus Liberibacter africanus PTSAPSY TaxID=1277257 RepID=A0A0G3I8I4_LIBAF|nr:signal peptidase II [Candidatus Liberibacter africanus]AKK20042.1 lipoprotein signal peptidase [Candidatus Liberibacter africanus PTSAPSY]QTP63865.1 signal peptidase II [Candidatus Liberibacter africanus]